MINKRVSGSKDAGSIGGFNQCIKNVFFRSHKEISNVFVVGADGTNFNTGRRTEII